MKTRLLLGLMGLLVVFAASLVLVQVTRKNQDLQYIARENNLIGVRVLFQQLHERYPRLSWNTEVDTFTWPSMPAFLAETDADGAAAATGLLATIFRLDPTTGEFVRRATTIETSPGTRAVGTVLARGPVFDAMMQGQPFEGEADILGQRYVTYYHPVLNEGGETVGILFVGQTQEALTALLNESVRGSVLATLILAVFAIALSWGLLTVYLRPFERAKTIIDGMAKGDLTLDIADADRNDEFGGIARALSKLQASMRKAEDLKAADAHRAEEENQKRADQALVVERLSEGLARLSELDLTTRIENTPGAPFPAAYDALRVSFNQLVQRLSETIEEIRLAAEEVNADAKEMTGSSMDLSSRTESQAATLQESAAALEELSQSVQSTAENAADAEATTTENRAVAKAADEIVSNAVTAMEEIEASSQQITQIISVIDDIAFQTNLLALNAGVEAARAGDAGRGFAVVASEVRALAQHSSASAQEIKDLIAASSQQVETGSSLVKEAGTALTDIIDRVDKVAGLVSDIAMSAKEQSVGVSEINSGVRALDAATQSNAAMAEETSAASEGLTNAAERMTAQLARFQIADTAVINAPNWAEAAAAKAATPEPSTQLTEPIPMADAVGAEAFHGF